MDFTSYDVSKRYRQMIRSANPDPGLQCSHRPACPNYLWHYRTRPVYEPAPTKWPLCPAKTQISLGICPVWSVCAVCIKKPWVLSYLLSTQRRLIRLGRCPGWSESLLCAQVILLVLSCCGSIFLYFLRSLWKYLRLRNHPSQWELLQVRKKMWQGRNQNHEIIRAWRSCHQNIC